MNPELAPYQGLWRREYLRDDQGTDTETEVYWLQVGRWYVDIRLPPARPGFDRVASLDELAPAQVRWMATVEGFCGELSVDGDLLTWHREVDFQPPSSTPDTGRVRRLGNVMIESGVLRSYEESWLFTPVETGTRRVMRLHRTGGQGLALMAGDWRMQCVEQRAPLPVDARLSDLATPGSYSLRALFDCRIDFAYRDRRSGGWRIARSTHPWHEGEVLDAASDAAAGWCPLGAGAPEGNDNPG
jgi:hypothetical protein